MTPTLLFAVTAAIVFGGVVFTVRRLARHANGGRAVDAGAVSTRWLSELRRDEPWTRT